MTPELALRIVLCDPELSADDLGSLAAPGFHRGVDARLYKRALDVVVAADAWPDDMPAERLELSVRAWNRVKKLTVGDLRRMRDAELLAINGLGRKTLGEIRALVRARPTEPDGTPGPCPST